MKIQEVMDRVGMRETSLAIAWIKDAANLLLSSSPDIVKVHKQDITTNDREYQIPNDSIAIQSVSVLDTNDSKYKKIRRISGDTTVTEDTDPN